MRFRMLSLVYRWNLICCLILAVISLCLVPIVPLYYVILQEVLAAVSFVWTVLSDGPVDQLIERGILAIFGG